MTPRISASSACGFGLVRLRTRYVQLDEREFGGVAGTHARLRDARIAAGAAASGRRDLLDELLYDGGLGDELGEPAARGEIAAHRRRDQPIGDAR